jgi:hypothetical protein
MPDPNNWYRLDGELADVSTASQLRFCVPVAGYLRRVGTTLGGAISGADSVITVSVDNSALSPTITIANASSAEGDYDEAEYYAPVKKGSWIEVATGGQSTDTAVLGVTLTLSG